MFNYISARFAKEIVSPFLLQNIINQSNYSGI